MIDPKAQAKNTKRAGRMALVALAGALSAGAAHADNANLHQATAMPLERDLASFATQRPADAAPARHQHKAIGAGLLAGALGVMALIWRFGPRQALRPAARAAAHTLRPAAKVAGAVVGATANMAGAGIAATVGALPKRLKWRLASVVALMGGVALLLANGWGVWLALSLLLVGAIGFVVNTPRKVVS
jgi:hypothetical protein